MVIQAYTQIAYYFVNSYVPIRMVLCDWCLLQTSWRCREPGGEGTISVLKSPHRPEYTREAESTEVASQSERIHGPVEYTIRYVIGGIPLLQYTAEGIEAPIYATKSYNGFKLLSPLCIGRRYSYAHLTFPITFERL